jgi:ubiquinone/menaquinone biosynthesis C-methylase UbiE
MTSIAESEVSREIFANLNCPFALMAIQMSMYSLAVMYPALLLQSAGVYHRRELGIFPSRLGFGSGQWYCRERSTLHLLEQPSSQYHRVVKFDQLSTLYQLYVAFFTQPIITEALNIIEPLLPSDTRLLDLSCGPGTEIGRLARLLTSGEIVGVDLSAGMIEIAHRNAKEQALTNVAFVQADACAMPGRFTGRFDGVLCCLAFHHYSRPIVAAREIHRLLGPGGLAFIIDPASEWFNQIAAPLAAWADPGWVSFYSAEDLHRIFIGTGFSEFYWCELLPGIGLSIATK